MTDRDPAELFRPKAAAEAGRPPRLGRLPRAAIGLGAAILLGYFVIRVSAADALLQLGTDAPAMVSPAHAEARLRRAYDELRLTGAASGESRRAALEAYRTAPLSEVPLLIAAREARNGGDDARSDRLLAAAVRRNPRSRYALLLQLEQDLRLGRDREAAVRMAVLTRLFSDVGGILVSEIARMAADPDTRAAAVQVMAGDPGLKAQVLEALARRGTDPDVVLELAGPLPALAPGAAVPRWQQLLISGLVDRGELARAHAIWSRLLGDDGSPRDRGLYDPEFRGLPGPPPFNWVLEMSADGFAERSAGGLNVEYYGRNDARLASQLMLLPAGRYRLAFEAEGQAEGEEGQLAWTVSCHPGDSVLVAVPIVGVEFTPKRFTGEFTVPQGCAGQWLRLSGESAEFPKPQQVTIRDLRIARAGS